MSSPSRVEENTVEHRLSASGLSAVRIIREWESREKNLITD